MTDITEQPKMEDRRPKTGMQPLLIVVGPTGSGKTAVAVELCALLNGEIVSADSMQIYRGMDIGTAKPTAGEQARARHHLINIREPDENYSAAEWARDAQAAIADITARGRQPILAGGTGFYLRALLQPATLPDAPPDPALRARLESEAAEYGPEYLHGKLSELDAAAAARLHPNDVRRVIRAIEVASSSVPSVKAGDGKNRGDESTALLIAGYRPIVWGLEMPREQLYARLNRRIDAMLASGFMDELRALIERGVSLQGTAMQSLGYCQMLPALHDATQMNECAAIWKRDTRRYAKRQMTWFRHQLPTRWIEMTEDTPSGDIAQTIACEWGEHLSMRAQEKER
jgi:tRNA dimethylallyltransferase